MPCIEYKTINFTEATRKTILSANAIIRQYRAEGYILTLRQLYYQFVARALIGNKQTEYNRLGSIINDARLAGLIDWKSIEDRTRNLRVLSHWDSPADIINSAAVSYREDLWKEQDYRVEVWIEKDALLGVIENVCDEFDVPYFSCRGYVSQSEMWSAAQRIIGCEGDGKKVVILHLGDHDPSGLDMTRDIRDRLELFEAGPEVIRIALTEEQIAEYDPPPNPAKTKSNYRPPAPLQDSILEALSLGPLSIKDLAWLIKKPTANISTAVKPLLKKDKIIRLQYGIYARKAE